MSPSDGGMEGKGRPAANSSDTLIEVEDMTSEYRGGKVRMLEDGGTWKATDEDVAGGGKGELKRSDKDNVREETGGKWSLEGIISRFGVETLGKEGKGKAGEGEAIEGEEKGDDRRGEPRGEDETIAEADGEGENVETRGAEDMGDGDLRSGKSASPDKGTGNKGEEYGGEEEEGGGRRCHPPLEVCGMPEGRRLLPEVIPKTKIRRKREEWATEVGVLRKREEHEERLLVREVGAAENGMVRTKEGKVKNGSPQERQRQSKQMGEWELSLMPRSRSAAADGMGASSRR